MEHSPRNVSAAFYWYERPLRADEYLDWLVGLIELLHSMDGRFASIFAIDDNTDTVVPVAGQNLREVFYASLPREVAYDNGGSDDRTLHHHSRCPLGFDSSFVTDLRGPGYSVSVSVGKLLRSKANRVAVEISEEIEDSSLARALFAKLLSFCRPLHANLNRIEVADLLAQRPGDVHVGALTYVNDADIERFLPSEVTAGRVSDGLLLDIGGTFPHAHDTARVEEIRRIIDALEPHGVLLSPSRRHIN